MQHQVQEANGVSSEAVFKATGKHWDEWFSILDQAGAVDLNHQQIVAILADQHQVGAWWQQMVTVGYEQVRGLRKKHQTVGGFQVSASKTIQASLDTIFSYWIDPEKRQTWLVDDQLNIHRSTSGKSIRATWNSGGNIDVGFYAKGPEKTQVQIGHVRIRDAETAEGYKTYWREALDRLKSHLETK